MREVIPGNDFHTLRISRYTSTFAAQKQSIPFRQVLKVVQKTQAGKIIVLIFASYLNKTYFCAVWILSK